MNRVLVVLAGLGVLTAAVFGIVYGAVENSDSSGARGAGQGALPSTANELARHADAMRKHGEEMVEVGRAQGRDVWVEQGTDLMLTARRLETIADQLRRTDRDLSLYRPEDSVNIYRLRADGRAIVDAGEALLDHGALMAEMAVAMEESAAGVAELTGGADVMAADADTLKEDGRLVIAAGQPLLDEADQLERSLGH